MDWERMSIKEIEEYLQRVKAGRGLIEELALDPRKGVQRLADRLKRKLEREERLEKKWLIFNRRETALREEGYRMIAGIDEAGRGPLAGPVAAAAVIFPGGIRIKGLDDSKKLSEADREELFAEIREKALSLGVGLASNQEIDRLNILQATYLAMKRALQGLSSTPDYILVDGDRTIPGIQIKQEAVTGGDGSVNAIAAASILAKVSRDRLLKDYHRRYPEYGFINNKGYGTGEHIEALKKYGPSPLHRFSFSIVRESAFDYYKEGLTRAESGENLKVLGEKIARTGFFSEENLGFLRELYRQRYQELLGG